MKFENLVRFAAVLVAAFTLNTVPAFADHRKPTLDGDWLRLIGNRLEWDAAVGDFLLCPPVDRHDQSDEAWKRAMEGACSDIGSGADVVDKLRDGWILQGARDRSGEWLLICREYPRLPARFILLHEVLDGVEGGYAIQIRPSDAPATARVHRVEMKMQGDHREVTGCFYE